jgi:hypothetical protein
MSYRYHYQHDGLGKFNLGKAFKSVTKAVGKIIKDPIGSLVAAPGQIIDAAAGGPQQRGRARAANAQATAIRATAAAAQQSSSEIATQSTQRAAARVAELQAAAAAETAADVAAAAAETAAAKKKLIKTVAIGGGAVVGLGVLAWFITRD